MLTSIKENLPLILLQLILLPLLFLGDSNYGYYFFSLIPLMWLVSWKRLNWEKLTTPQAKKIHWLWLIYWVFFALSFVFSQNWPISLNSFLIQLFTFNGFYFFWLLDSQRLDKESMAFYFLLLVTFLSLFSYFFYIFPDWRNMLPVLNLVFPSYGHNHLAALLILIFPMSLWFVLNQGDGQKKRGWWWLLPAFLLFNLIFSLGRVAIVIGGLQLLWLKRRVGVGKEKRIFTYINFVFWPLLVIALSYGVINFHLMDLPCPQFIQTQLCKDFAFGPRQQYLSRAWNIWQEHPVFGSGPGTYGIVLKKFQEIPFHFSEFAHNIFLEKFAELGVFGGTTFFVLITTMMWMVTKKVADVKSSILSLNEAFLIGAWGFYLNMWFDFDWSLPALQLIFLIFLALIFRSDDAGKKGVSVISEIVFKVTNSLLLILVLLILATDLLLLNKQEIKAFKIFPYFEWQLDNYVESSSLNSSEREQLFSVYKNHPDFYYQVITEDWAQPQRPEFLKNYFRVEPWNQYSLELIEHQIEASDLSQAQQTINKLWQNWQSARNEWDYVISLEDSAQLASLTLNLADKYYLNGQVQIAGQLYSQAATIDQATFEAYQPIFVEHQLGFDKVLLFFSNLELNQGDVSRFNLEYANQLTNAIQASIESNQLLNLQEYYFLSGVFAEWYPHVLWNDIAPIILERQQKENILYLFWWWQQLNSQERELVSWDYQYQLSAELVSMGNEVVMVDMHRTLDLYASAREIIPWILVDQSTWHNIYDLSEVPNEQLQILVERFAPTIETYGDDDREFYQSVVDHLNQ